MRDLHMHTVFSDGQNTPEEMILSALEKGLDCVGFSDHSGDDCGMTPERTLAYRAEIARMKEKYAGRIRVLCGLERDYYSEDTLEYDYVIGSVHWIRMPDSAVSVDWTAEKQQEGVNRCFGGDWYAFAETYYGMVSRIVEVTKCDIIGHFDLLTKFMEQDPRFDVRHPRYVAAWQRAADLLIRTGKPFEINTGAMSRGYRTGPYPAGEIRDYIRRNGGKLILSSDSHRKETIAYRFEDYLDEADEADF
jgi:histidinol phosphate phosphatase HisJ family